MKTQVIMKRQLFGYDIRQQSQTEFFSATDLVNAGNEWRKQNGLIAFNLSQFLKQKTTADFINELEKEGEPALTKGRGRSSSTWVHPYLFIDIALAISPQLKIEVYEWLKDELLKYRNDSGDGYKKMCGALYLNMSNKSLFPRYIINVADRIKESCNVTDWQTATEDQLKLRDKIQDNISLLSDVLTDNDQAVKLGILKAIDKI